MQKKIVVIDDSRTARTEVRNALEPAGYLVLEALDGRDGLTKIAGNPDASLVICDVNMPGMNGIEMLWDLQTEMPQVKIPIIMLTTEQQPQLLQSAKQAGAKGWIVKPFKPPMLIAAVKKLVGDV